MDLIIGCGLTGGVIVRQLAEQGHKVEIWERRDHIDGNIYVYMNEHGFLVQKYGSHIFHTTKKSFLTLSVNTKIGKITGLPAGLYGTGNILQCPSILLRSIPFIQRKSRAIEEKTQKGFYGTKKHYCA